MKFFEFLILVPDPEDPATELSEMRTISTRAHTLQEAKDKIRGVTEGCRIFDVKEIEMDPKGPWEKE